MISIFFFLLAIFFFYLSRIIGKRWFWGYFLGGLSFGIYNEICFEFCWQYSPLLGPMIWRDVPIIVIVGWGIFATLGLVLSNRIYKGMQITNPYLHKLFDILFFSCIGFSVEMTAPALGLWKYNFHLQSVIPVQIMGYLLVGLLVSCTGRRMQMLIDIKKPPEQQTDACLTFREK
jgi:hypothetical protein